MSAILRWFHDGGVRHRVYFRTDEPSGRRDIVIAGPDVEVALPARVESLNDFTEDELVQLARRAREADGHLTGVGSGLTL